MNPRQSPIKYMTKSIIIEYVDRMKEKITFRSAKKVDFLGECGEVMGFSQTRPPKRTFDHSLISQDQFDPFWCPIICSWRYIMPGHITLDNTKIKVRFATFTQFVCFIVVLFTSLVLSWQTTRWATSSILAKCECFLIFWLWVLRTISLDLQN